MIRVVIRQEVTITGSDKQIARLKALKASFERQGYTLFESGGTANETCYQLDRQIANYRVSEKDPLFETTL